MSGRIPVARALALFVFVTGAGYATMALTTPSDQEFYDQLAPDLKKRVDENRRQKDVMKEKQAQLDAIKASADNEKPVWASSLPKKV